MPTAEQVAEALSNQARDEDVRSPEEGSVQEHRTASAWLRKNYSEKETLLQIHLVLVDILAALRKK